ncbi:DUF6368 family protein [uncultured Aquimarina sp.]|uniref:DUF6368 family protein n=1 Tax=uncultured Aquimarina sp. TaxID=575652 RepID=UPI00260EA3E8|nr:DUF6368 family protein [uncultured Aquimarina sp.]
MGGFTNLIYFKEYLSDKSINQIKKTIESCGKFEVENELDYDITVEHKGENYPFRIYYSDAKDDKDFDSESKAEFIKTIGYVPKCYIGFMAWTNEKYGQKFISELMLKVLEIENGLVDFSAAIDPSLTGNRDKIKKFVSQIGGKIMELEYETADDRIWFTHLADKEFLNNWVGHKKFYIPK